MRNFYEIMEVSAECTLKEIKSSYRKLVKQYHPDKNKQHIKLFEEITCAYTTLKNPDKRKQYDLHLQENKELRPRKKFRFREFKDWLFKFSFIRALFGMKRVAVTPQSESIRSIDTKALIQRILYSPNVHVQISAVQAILDQGNPDSINDLIRLLYSGIGEGVKLQIIEGIRSYRDPHIRDVLQDVYQGEKSIKLKQRIMHSLQLNPGLN